MGFETLPQALDEGRALSPIQANETAFPGETLSDEDALKIVLQDISIAEKFLNSKSLPNEWDTCDQLVRAYVSPKPWPNSNARRANLSMPVVLEAIEAVMPQVHMAFFSDIQPFLCEPVGRTSKAAASAMGHIATWATEEAKFKEEVRLMLKSCLQYGTMVCKYGWQRNLREEKTFVRSESGKVTPKTDTHELWSPTIENIPLGNLLVDTALRTHDITRSRFVIHQQFLDAIELDDLRDEYGEKVPTREEFKTILAEQAEQTTNSLQAQQQLTFRENQAELPTSVSSANPLRQNLEILEHTTADRVITVLQRKIVLRNEPNEFGEVNYRSCAFIDVLNSFYGFGIAKLLEGEQRFQTGVANKWVDSLDLKLSPMFHRKKGMGQQSQNILAAPGRVVNDDGDLTPLEVPDITQEALGAIQSSEARASRRVGSNSGPEMPTQAMRTAEGVQAFQSGVQGKLQYFVDTFGDMVFVPIIEVFIKLCKENLQPDAIEAILTDKEGKAFAGDVLDVYNGKYKIKVLSSTKLAARRAMAQMIPMMLQAMGQPAFQQGLQVQGNKIDMEVFVQQILDITGWPAEDLVVPMTDQDKQALQSMNQAAVRAQAQLQAQQQQQQNELQQIDAKGDVQAGVAAVKTILKHHADAASSAIDAAHEAQIQPLADQQPQGQQ